MYEGKKQMRSLTRAGVLTAQRMQGLAECGAGKVMQQPAEGIKSNGGRGQKLSSCPGPSRLPGALQEGLSCFDQLRGSLKRSW